MSKKVISVLTIFVVSIALSAGVLAQYGETEITELEVELRDDAEDELFSDSFFEDGETITAVVDPAQVESTVQGLSVKLDDDYAGTSGLAEERVRAEFELNYIDNDGVTQETYTVDLNHDQPGEDVSCVTGVGDFYTCHFTNLVADAPEDLDYGWEIEFNVDYDAYVE